MEVTPAEPAVQAARTWRQLTRQEVRWLWFTAAATLVLFSACALKHGHGSWVLFRLVRSGRLRHIANLRYVQFWWPGARGQ